MPKPIDHTHSRNWMETILRYIPGFRGYLEKEYRRDSDELQRRWLADRLQQSKRRLDDFARGLVDAGRLDALGQVDRVRVRLDRLIGRISSAMQGYSGVFDLVRINEAVLDRVYQHDAGLVEEVEALATSIEQLPAKTDEPAVLAAALLAEMDELEEAWDQREDLLKGLE
jgi:hypothetical protein